MQRMEKPPEDLTVERTVRYTVKELTMNVSKQSETQSGSWNQKV